MFDTINVNQVMPLIYLIEDSVSSNADSPMRTNLPGQFNDTPWTRVVCQVP